MAAKIAVSIGTAAEGVKVEQGSLGPNSEQEQDGAPEQGAPAEDLEGPNGEAEHGGESSGNNASNGTTQKLEKGEEAAAEASTAPKPPADDLQELANRGLCAPLWRTAKPSQPGVGVPDVEQLQTGWCNYSGLATVQRGSTWLAASSPAVQTRAAQHPLGAATPVRFGSGRGVSAPSFPPLQQIGSPQSKRGQQTASQPLSQSQGRDQGVFAARPPAASLPVLPASPFSKSAVPASPFRAARDAPAVLPNGVGTDSPFTPSTQTKFQWPDDFGSPRNSHSDGDQKLEPGRNNSLTRQVSLPDFGDLADLWAEMSNAPEDCQLDFDALPSLPKSGGLLPLNSSLGFGLRQASLAKLTKQDIQMPVGSLLHDIKSQRRNRSLKINTALTWQPGTEPDLSSQARRNSGRLQSLQMTPALRDSLAVADRSSSTGGFHSPNEGTRARGPELPDQVQLSIVAAPSIFAVPTCINKTFKPPFTVRVTIVSPRHTQIKATVAAYTLQREQIAKLEQWHPSQHIFTESLAGAIVSETIICEGPENTKSGEVAHGKHVGVADLTFTDLKFNASSRMKPRWVVFALALPTDDVIFTQFTVPTIVMSRQCDQTPRALAILRGEAPTRKRARQQDAPETLQGRSKSLFTGLAAPLLGPAARIGAPHPGTPGPFTPQPNAVGRASLQLPDQGSINVGGFYGDDEEWPQHGPFTMIRWREAIVKVCREYGLTRSFEQEDMHELAKVAGFMGSPQTGSQQMNLISVHQWNAFGRWFLSYLHIFKDHRDLWMSSSIMCICGFSVTRERAEQLLMGQPEGTFLLRPSLSMESTIVISVARGSRVYHLAIDAQQLETRTIEDWIRELPDVAFLLDINSGVRYPKFHIFRSRHAALVPATPRLLSLQAPLMSPMGPPAMSPTGIMPPSHPQGADALAHILEASRRGSSQFASPQLGQFGAGQVPLGHIPIGSAGGDHLGQLFDQWGHMDLHDPLRVSQMGGLADTHTSSRALHSHMRFGGH